MNSDAMEVGGSGTTPADVTVPVLIVGGGGAGLTASMLLSTYGVNDYRLKVVACPHLAAGLRGRLTAPRLAETGQSDCGC